MEKQPLKFETSLEADVVDKAMQHYMKTVIDELPNEARRPLADAWQAAWSTVGKLRLSSEVA